MWIKFLLWLSPLRLKILNSVIFILLLLLTYIIIINPSDITDLLPITKAYCVNHNEIVLRGEAQLSIESHTPLNDEVEELSDESFVESQQIPNTHFSFPHIFPGCSNRMSSRIIGGLTGTVLGFGLTAWILADSGIDFVPHACNLIDWITGTKR